MKKACIIFLALVLLALGCKSTKQEQKPSDFIHIETIKKGTYSGVDYSGHIVISSTEEWIQCWQDIHSVQGEPPSLPEIDFEKKMLIAAYMGNKSSGGFTIDVERVEFIKDILKIKAVYNMPGQGCMSTMAITQPYVVVSIDKRAIDSSEIQITEKRYKCD